jgi:hypothetical protein
MIRINKEPITDGRFLYEAYCTDCKTIFWRLILRRGPNFGIPSPLPYISIGGDRSILLKYCCSCGTDATIINPEELI